MCFFTWSLHWVRVFVSRPEPSFYLHQCFPTFFSPRDPIITSKISGDPRFFFLNKINLFFYHLMVCYTMSRISVNFRGHLVYIKNIIMDGGRKDKCKYFLLASCFFVCFNQLLEFQTTPTRGPDPKVETRYTLYICLVCHAFCFSFTYSNGSDKSIPSSTFFLFNSLSLIQHVAFTRDLLSSE